MQSKRWFASPAAWRWAGMLAVLGSQAGCTVLSVHNAEVHTRLLPGFALVDVQPRADHIAVVRTQGLGLNAHTRGFNLGLFQQLSFIADGPQSCGTFIICTSKAEVQALQGWLATHAMGHLSPCVLNLESE